MRLVAVKYACFSGGKYVRAAWPFTCYLLRKHCSWKSETFICTKYIFFTRSFWKRFHGFLFLDERACFSIPQKEKPLGLEAWVVTARNSSSYNIGECGAATAKDRPRAHWSRSFGYEFATRFIYVFNALVREHTNTEAITRGSAIIVFQYCFWLQNSIFAF